MAAQESEIDMVRRHVRDGMKCVTRQQQVVSQLPLGGRSRELAEALLRQFEIVQNEHSSHLARLEFELQTESSQEIDPALSEL
ncbi:hypothetical protein ABEG18_19115 [Alsobacter sp. KACC 23698]|uniref:Uncharacterized protein n=1 Tax=Alsobacter sp. KACC 23698 TaxID=3149229 RepID=A0AAU7JC59_9HYPH